MEFTELLFRENIVERENEGRITVLYRAAAQTAYLLGAAGGRVSFNQYLRKLGLLDKKPPMTEQQKKIAIDKAHENARKVLSAAKRMKKR
jgi:hypothetical protein